MTDLPAARTFHPAHTLISWPAVIAGAAVAIAVGAMLNLLGVALGAASLNPFDLRRNDPGDFSALAGIWIALSNLVGLFVGGFVASRSAKYVDHHRGLLVGLSVWAVAFLVALLLVGASASGGVLSVLSVAPDVAGRPIAQLPPLGDAAGADPRLTGMEAPLPASMADQEMAAVADHTATVALWAFLTMLVGAAGAVFGSRYGLTRHGWETGSHSADQGELVGPEDGHRFEAPRGSRPSTGL